MNPNNLIKKDERYNVIKNFLHFFVSKNRTHMRGHKVGKIHISSTYLKCYLSLPLMAYSNAKCYFTTIDVEDGGVFQ